MSEAAPSAEGPLPRRFLFNVNFVFVSALTSNTLGFFAAILVARALGPDGQGIAALYDAAVGLGLTLLSFGVGGAVFYFRARGELTDRQALEVGLSVTLLAAFATAVCVLIAGVVFRDELARRPMPYGLAIVAVPALIQLRVVEGVLRARGRFAAMNTLELGLPIATLVALGAVEMTAGLTVSRAIWAWTLAYLPPLVTGYVLLGRDAWPRRPAPVVPVWRAARFGAQNQLSSIIQIVGYRVDLFLIAAFVSTSGVGLYSVAAGQTEGLWIVANSVAIVLLTSITGGDREGAPRLTPVVCRNTLLVTGIGAIAGAILAPLLLTSIFGAAYADALTPYLWLLPGTVALSGSKILAAYVFSRGRPIINAAISLATLVVVVPCDLLLISRYGVAGAAAGTSLGYAFDLLLSALAYSRLAGAPALEALLPRPADAAIYLNGLRALRQRLRRRDAVA